MLCIIFCCNLCFLLSCCLHCCCSACCSSCHHLLCHHCHHHLSQPPLVVVLLLALLLFGTTVSSAIFIHLVEVLYPGKIYNVNIFWGVVICIRKIQSTPLCIFRYGRGFVSCLDSRVHVKNYCFEYNYGFIFDVCRTSAYSLISFLDWFQTICRNSSTTKHSSSFSSLSAKKSIFTGIVRPKVGLAVLDTSSKLRSTESVDMTPKLKLKPRSSSAAVPSVKPTLSRPLMGVPARRQSMPTM